MTVGTSFPPDPSGAETGAEIEIGAKGLAEGALPLMLMFTALVGDMQAVAIEIEDVEDEDGEGDETEAEAEGEEEGEGEGINEDLWKEEGLLWMRTALNSPPSPAPLTTEESEAIEGVELHPPPTVPAPTKSATEAAAAVELLAVEPPTLFEDCMARLSSGGRCKGSMCSFRLSLLIPNREPFER